MAADRDKGSPGKAGSRRMRRAAVALGAATTLFCGVGVPNAGAAVTTGADVEAIKQLKHRYFASVDMDNWPQLYHDLAPDVVVDTTGALGPVFRGRAGFVAFDALLLTLLITHHEGYNPQITVSDDGLTATGVWQMNDRLFAPFNIIGVHGHGEYVDTYEKVDGRWVVKSSALTYNSSSIQILPGILNINIPFIDDGTGFPVSSPTQIRMSRRSNSSSTNTSRRWTPTTGHSCSVFSPRTWWSTPAALSARCSAAGSASSLSTLYC